MKQYSFRHAWKVFPLFILLGFLQAPDPSPDVTRLMAQGDSFTAAKIYDSAFYYFDEAVGLSKANGLPYAIAKIKAAQALIAARKTDEAIDYLEQDVSQALQRTGVLSDTTEQYYQTVAEAYYRAGNAFGSLKYHQKIYDIHRQRGDTPADKMIDLTRVMGVLYYNSGQLPHAIDFYNRYLDLITTQYGDNHLYTADAFNYLGMVYRYLGEPEKSIQYYQRAITTAERYTREERIAVSPRFASVAPLYNNLGNIYHDRKQYEQALEYSARAIAIRRADGEEKHPAMASLYASRAATLTILKKYDEALRDQTLALEIHQQHNGPKHGQIATAIKSLGNIYFLRGDTTKALDLTQQALTMNMDVHGVHHPNTGEAYAQMAQLREAQGDVTGALASIQRALQSLVHDFSADDIQLNPIPDALCLTRLMLLDKLVTKGRLLKRRYDHQKQDTDLVSSYETFMVAVGLAEIIRREFTDNSSKVYLSENMKSLYEQTIDVAQRLFVQTSNEDYIATAFDVMEKNKSRLLLEAVQYSQVKNNLDLPDSLLNMESSLKKQIAFYEEQLLKESLTRDQPDSVSIMVIQDRLFNAKRELDNLFIAYRKDYPNYYQAVDNSHTDLTKIHDALNATDALVEFFAGREALYVFYSAAHRQGLLRLDTSVYTIAHAMGQHIRSRERKSFVQLSTNCYEALLMPVLKALPSKPERVVIIPDGVLSSVPFEALMMDGDRYVLEEFNINYQYSAALMMVDRPEVKKPEVLGGFAPEFPGPMVAARGLPGNIPYAQKEVDVIMLKFPGRKYAGEEASESVFKNTAGAYAILHLATHAQVDEQEPSLSRLYLAGSDTLNDGLLYAYELYNMKISADLVTLSACNTAVGQWREGEGAMSLSRAFAYAGCPSIVTSLWPAQDNSTAEIMDYFYDNLKKGMSKDEALRQAKLTFLQHADDVKADPFYWAGFILIGDNTPVKSKTSSILYIIIGVVALGVVGYWINQRRRRQT